MSDAFTDFLFNLGIYIAVFSIWGFDASVLLFMADTSTELNYLRQGDSSGN